MTQDPWFYIEHHPEAADGAVWTVYSPGGVSVYRTENNEEAIVYRDLRNTGVRDQQTKEVLP